MTEKADKQRSVQPHGDAAMGVPAEATTVPQAPQSSPGDTNPQHLHVGSCGPTALATAYAYKSDEEIHAEFTAQQEREAQAGRERYRLQAPLIAEARAAKHASQDDGLGGIDGARRRGT